MKKFLSLILCSLLMVYFVSCGDDKDTDKIGAQTVTIKVTGSANLVIHTVTVVTGIDVQSYSDLNVNSWSKDVTYELIVGASAHASTSDELDGSMKIQILKGDTVLKEGTVEGTTFSLSIMYDDF